MTIIRNSAKCTACGAEIESTHRHDFVVHYCEVEAHPRTKITWRFAVDGGKDYIRRCGSGYQETSEFKDEPT
jgi:hypothetical protein